MKWRPYEVYLQQQTRSSSAFSSDAHRRKPQQSVLLRSTPQCLQCSGGDLKEAQDILANNVHNLARTELLGRHDEGDVCDKPLPLSWPTAGEKAGKQRQEAEQ